MSDSDSSFSEVSIVGASLLCNRVVTACGRVICSALILSNVMCFSAQTSPGPSSRKRNRASSEDIDESIDLTNVSSVLGLHTIFTCSKAETLYVAVLFDFVVQR